jgi:transposase InsO family protein
MNDILDNLFYKEKLGIGNKTTFIKKVRERHPEIKVKDINEYLKNQEVSQINTTVNKTYQYKITAPPRTFQIDIFWWKRGETLIPILLLVDILSRKAWAYVLTKSKQEKRAEVSVKTLEEFKNEVGQINGLTGDNEFSSAAIRKFCEDNNIRLDTSVAKEEHISNGNKLGIIDRLVRTLRELIEKYYDITGYRTDNIKDVIASVIETYNNNSHRTLKNKTPNQVYKDNDDQTARHLNDTAHNQAIYKSVPFNDGDKVRILEKKEKFDKGKQKFSKEIYTINKKEGYKILVNGTSRKLKPSELLKASTTANPIAEKYIQEKKEEKKKGKVINSLVRNAKMTPAEAKAAVATVNEPGGRGQREKKKVVKMDL